MKLILIAFLIAQASIAASIDISAFYKLDPRNSQDRSAEVCFKVEPKPQAPQFATIYTDKGYKSQGIYTAWVGPEGAVCKVVATFRGTVEVSVDGSEDMAKKEL